MSNKSIGENENFTFQSKISLNNLTNIVLLEQQFLLEETTVILKLRRNKEKSQNGLILAQPQLDS